MTPRGERVVHPTIVVPICQIVGKVDGAALMLFQQPLVNVLSIGNGDLACINELTERLNRFHRLRPCLAIQST